MGELSRNEVAQQAPTDDQLQNFPYIVTEQSTIYRAKQRRYDAWHFASVPNDASLPSVPSDAKTQGGRFHLADPRGTCYWADDVETAVREVLGGRTLHANQVTDVRAKAVNVATSSTSSGAELANLTDPLAVRHGAGRELSTMPDYRIPQLWAAGFDSIGYSGIRYASRFTSGTVGPNSWAFFDYAGDGDTTRFEGSTIDGEDACEQAGIVIVKTPTPRTPSTALTLVDEIPVGAD